MKLSVCVLLSFLPSLIASSAQPKQEPKEGAVVKAGKTKSETSGKEAKVVAEKKPRTKAVTLIKPKDEDKAKLKAADGKKKASRDNKPAKKNAVKEATEKALINPAPPKQNDIKVSDKTKDAKEEAKPVGESKVIKPAGENGTQPPKAQGETSKDAPKTEQSPKTTDIIKESGEKPIGDLIASPSEAQKVKPYKKETLLADRKALIEKRQKETEKSGKNVNNAAPRSPAMGTLGFCILLGFALIL